MARGSKSRVALAALPLCGLLAVVACEAEDIAEDPATGEVSTATVAALLAMDEDLSAASSVLSETGLQSLLDGNAPYTVFAPTNAVFDEVSVALEGEDLRAARVAVIRAHIVPGYLTLDDISAALEDASDPVEVQTMGGNTLSFSDEADGLLITSSDGATAHIDGGALEAVNGTIFPVDGLLKSVEPAE